MRILHTIPGRNWGGMEFRVIEQVAWLNAHGHPAWLATPAGGESFKRAAAQGLPVIDADFDHPWRPRVVRQLRHLLADLKIEVADVHVTRDAKALMACLDLVAVVRSRHITQRLKPGILRSLQWRLGADRVIAVAGCIRKSMIADGLADFERADVVGEWADEAFFAPGDEAIRSSKRGEWGCKSNEFVLATVSMLRPDKGLEYAVRAMPALIGAGMPVKLIVIGGATGEGAAYSAFLKSEAVRLKVDSHVVFPGYSEHVAHCLMAADAVVVPSVANEAQSRIVPQAFAAQKPVVATRVGGLPELVHEGKTGLLVPPGDAYALAMSIERLASDPHLVQELVSHASSYADAHLRMARQMQATLDIYSQALERARQRSYFRKTD